MCGVNKYKGTARGMSMISNIACVLQNSQHFNTVSMI